MLEADRENLNKLSLKAWNALEAFRVELTNQGLDHLAAEVSDIRCKIHPIANEALGIGQNCNGVHPVGMT